MVARPSIAPNTLISAMMKYVPVEPEELMRQQRQKLGLSLRAAADRAGLSHTHWSNLERGLASLSGLGAANLEALLDT